MSEEKAPASEIPTPTPRLDQIVEGVVLSETPPLRSIPGSQEFFNKLADAIEAQDAAEANQKKG